MSNNNYNNGNDILPNAINNMNAVGNNNNNNILNNVNNNNNNNLSGLSMQ